MAAKDFLIGCRTKHLFFKSTVAAVLLFKPQIGETMSLVKQTLGDVRFAAEGILRGLSPKVFFEVFLVYLLCTSEPLKLYTFV